MADGSGTTPDLTAKIDDLAGRSLNWWKSKLRVYMQQTRDARAALAATEQKLAQATAARDAATHDRDEAKARVAELEAHVNQLQTQVTEATNLRDVAETRIAELEAQVARHASEITDANTQRDHALAQVADLTTQHGELTARHQELQRQHAEIDIDAIWARWEQKANEELAAMEREIFGP